MKAEIVGMQHGDFKAGNGDEIKYTKYHLVVDTGEIEGKEVDTLFWNEIEKGSPPLYKLKDTVDVQYNKRGKLAFAKAS